MNMKKISDGPPNSIDAAIEAWRAAKEASAQALKVAGMRRQESQGTRDSLSHARFLEAQISALTAATVEEEAQIAAHVAVLAAEVDRGDELAMAVDPAALHRDLTNGQVEIADLEERIRAARKALDDRLALAQDALLKLRARRASEGMPPPRSLPEGRYADVVTLLEEILAKGYQPKAHRAHTIRQLEAQARDTRARIEQARIDAERKEAQRREALALEAAKRAKQEAEDAAIAAKASAASKREADRRAELAAANRARDAEC